MSQVKKEMLKKNEKFEDGVLRADACMERYLTTRDSQYRTHQEDLPGILSVYPHSGKKEI